MKKDWNALLPIAEALFQREAMRAQSLNERCSALAAKQHRLNTLIDRSREDLRQGHSSQSKGGDVLWQIWVTQNQRELNIEKANLLAQRDILMPGVRKCFGQKTVIESLARNAKESVKDNDESL